MMVCSQYKFFTSIKFALLCKSAEILNSSTRKNSHLKVHYSAHDFSSNTTRDLQRNIHVLYMYKYNFKLNIPSPTQLGTCLLAFEMTK